MTTLTPLPASIRATIHQDAIARVTRFFDASPRQTLDELFQNSRRAGATKVNVTLENNILTVTDNGRGIEDPAAVLGFGHSHWRPETTAAEDPAGMGLYSLARKENVIIRSNTGAVAWQVKLEEDHFTGQRAAPLEILNPADTPRGTAVSFQDQKAHRDRIHEAARYFPLPVTLNGHAMAQSDFLEKAAYVETWRGVRIGVHCNNTSYPGQDNLNFHGMTIQEEQMPSVWAINRIGWFVKWDVYNCPDLELTLPARQSLVRNEFLEQLKTASRVATFRAIKQHPEPVDLRWSLYQEARELGITLPEARPLLYLWNAETQADQESYRSIYPQPLKPLTPRSLIIHARHNGNKQSEAEAQDQKVLQRALELHSLDAHAMKPNDDLAGYQWYDQTPRVESFEVFTDDGSGLTSLWDDRKENQQSPFDGRLSAIIVRLNVVKEGVASTIDLPTDLAFWDEHCNSVWNLADPIITKETNLWANELAEIMMDAYFYPENGDQCYEDEYDTAFMQCLKKATSLLSSQEEAVRQSLEAKAAKHLLYELPVGWNATIQISGNMNLQVSVTAPEN